MSYESHSYRQPQHPHQDDYYSGEQNQKHAPPNMKGAPQQGRGMTRFASQPASMNAGHRSGGLGDGGGDAGAHTQKPRLSPMNADSAFPTFPNSTKRAIPVPPGSLPIDDSMLFMNLEDSARSKPMPRQRGPPGPHGHIPRAQTMEPERMRGRPPPTNFARGGGQAGQAPHEELRSQGQRGPHPHQRLPPPRGNIPGAGPHERGFPPGPGRPPVRQNAMGGYGQGPNFQHQNQRYMDNRGHPQSDQGYADPGFGPPKRSVTAPMNPQYQNQGQYQAPEDYSEHDYPQQQQYYPQQQQQYEQSPPPPAKPQQQQYTAYNPAQHGSISPPSAPRAAAYSHLQPPIQEEGYNRESVGALLDSYYYSEQSDGYQEGGTVDYHGDQSGHSIDPYQNGQSNYTHNPNFSRHAHRTRSQPDLRGQKRGGPAPPMPTNACANVNHYQNAGQYDGVREMPVEMQADIPSEMPGDLPPEKPVAMTANGFPPAPPQSNIPMVLRVGSPVPAQQRQIQPFSPPPPQQQNAFPPRTASIKSNPALVSDDSLPYYLSLTSARFSSDVPRFSSEGPRFSSEAPRFSSDAPRFSSDSTRPSYPDSLPAHPAPVRPGLLQQQDKSSLPGHPPPRRQYSPEGNGAKGRRGSAPAPITQFDLNQAQQSARANPGDQKLQLQLAKKMVEAASVLADEGGSADAKTTRKNRENFIFDAHKIIKKLANSSHPYPDAMFYLAECYWEGMLGLQVDREKAFNLYQSAAKLNHSPSAYRTAVCCELGAGTKRDPLKSITWYKKASALGDSAAMYKLGMIMLKGLLGQTRNGREAINWLKRAADQADENNPHALHQLALMYEEADPSDFVIPDQDYSRELFMKAAELGYPPSQFRMGCAFEYGVMGCPIDPMQSIAWYSRAAMQGEEESAMALSGWYLTGAECVIQQSDTEAYLWARKAAERGLANAEYALGYFTEVGIGVSENLDEAKRWYFKAASQNHEKAKQRLQELKKGGSAVQKSRERLSRSNVKQKEDGECVIM
ncbi:hypothetical protein DFP73DRAFT_149942 [Morchella snyderi]|nr:hypothetical protein DFP73DRAFT_149942 [Morchella snyderi]